MYASVLAFNPSKFQVSRFPCDCDEFILELSSEILIFLYLSNTMAIIATEKAEPKSQDLKIN